ncbi:hypothetical protein BKA65DRAFT_483607 [Rhexocercosporidium sp. MPI-PUGE-AT-0058]|nr:hypothetical protein BKA65DRAFT_483607 [Rhexocercosporidium sp. MPI-PUGE-AT-0058]
MLEDNAEAAVSREGFQGGDNIWYFLRNGIHSEYPKYTALTKYETITITKPRETYPVYETKTIKTEYLIYTTETKYKTTTKSHETYPPVYQTTKTNEGEPSKPVYTIETYPVIKPVETYPVHGPTTTLSGHSAPEPATLRQLPPTSSLVELDPTRSEVFSSPPVLPLLSFHHTLSSLTFGWTIDLRC